MTVLNAGCCTISAAVSGGLEKGDTSTAAVLMEHSWVEFFIHLGYVGSLCPIRVVARLKGVKSLETLPGGKESTLSTG